MFNLSLVGVCMYFVCVCVRVCVFITSVITFHLY